MNLQKKKKNHNQKTENPAKFVRYQSLPDTIWFGEGFLVNLKEDKRAQRMICGGQIIARVHLETPALPTAILLVPRGRMISIYFSYNYKNTSRDPHSPAPSAFNIMMSYVYASFFMLDVRLIRKECVKTKVTKFVFLYFYRSGWSDAHRPSTHVHTHSCTWRDGRAIQQGRPAQ